MIAENYQQYLVNNLINGLSEKYSFPIPSDKFPSVQTGLDITTACYSPHENKIKIPLNQRFDGQMYGEEVTHYFYFAVQSKLFEGVHWNVMIHEFFGYLGRYLSKEITAQRQLILYHRDADNYDYEPVITGLDILLNQINEIDSCLDAAYRQQTKIDLLNMITSFITHTSQLHRKHHAIEKGCIDSISMLHLSLMRYLSHNTGDALQTEKTTDTANNQRTKTLKLEDIIPRSTLIDTDKQLCKSYSAIVGHYLRRTRDCFTGYHYAQLYMKHNQDSTQWFELMKMSEEEFAKNIPNIRH